MKEVIKDLEKRGLRVAAFICQTEDKQLQVLAYDDKGLVYFVSNVVDSMSINERVEGRCFRAICDIAPKGEVVKQ